MQQLPGTDKLPSFDTHRFSFTGSGSAYFKIWIVDILLNVLTLGMYSAWATVRRLQYFDRHTVLAGAPFDYDGKPKAILRARLLFALLLGVSWYVAGPGVLMVLAMSCMVGSRLQLRARINHTRYRGARFGFSGSVRSDFLAYLAPLLIIFVLAVCAQRGPGTMFFPLAVVLVLCAPLIFGLLIRYQHRHLQFATLSARYEAGKWRCYPPYLQSIVLAPLMLANAAAVLALVMFVCAKLGLPTLDVTLRSNEALFMGLLATYIVYLLVGPYAQVQVSNRAWSATTLPGLHISSHLKPMAYLRMQAGSAILTLLTLGLYRPFAVVRAYRYRLDHMSVAVGAGFDLAVWPVKTDDRSVHPDSADRAPQHWRAALLALVLMVGGAIGFFHWGWPVIADRIAAGLPFSSDQRLGDQSMRLLPAPDDTPSVVAPLPLAQLEYIFRQVLPIKSRVPMRLVVSGFSADGPDMAGLPNGTIVVNSELLYWVLSEQQQFDERRRDAIAALLAHEIGHIQQRHAMRALVRSSILATVPAMLAGDISKVLARDPGQLLNIVYSPEMEAEADEYMLGRMAQAGWPTAPMDELYTKLETAVRREDKNTPAWMANHLSYVRKHPLSTERRARLFPLPASRCRSSLASGPPASCTGR